MREFTLAVATGNPNKVREIQSVLGPLGVRVLPAPEGFAPEENGTTFEENSRVKAFALADALAPEAAGIDGVIADDSGLCVDALGGAPGVWSARFAGASGDDERNTAKLLGLLEGVPHAGRTARFVCVITLLTQTNTCSQTDGACVTVCRGECEGRITTTPRGTSGFGYDPVFVPLSEEAAEGGLRAARTFAEMTPAEKNAVSHRALALAKLYEALSGGGLIG
jgi:XTP/dITP diphosphohydrolase